MLLGNGYLLGRGPARNIGVGSGAVGARSPFDRQRRQVWLGFYGGEGTRNNSGPLARWNGVPIGTMPPVSWHPPITAGGMCCRISGQATVVANGYMAYAVIASITGDGSMTASAVLVAAAAAAISGTGTLTADLLGIIFAQAAITGSGGITTADLSALAYALAALDGTGVCTFDMTAIAHVAADIRTYGDLSAEAVRDAILDAVLETGPQGTFTLAEEIRLIAAAVAGAMSGGPGTPAFKALSDLMKTRINGTADSNGDRSGITYDASE